MEYAKGVCVGRVGLDWGVCMGRVGLDWEDFLTQPTMVGQKKFNPTQPTWVGLGQVEPMDLTNFIIIINKLSRKKYKY